MPKGRGLLGTGVLVEPRLPRDQHAVRVCRCAADESPEMDIEVVEHDSGIWHARPHFCRLGPHLPGSRDPRAGCLADFDGAEPSATQPPSHFGHGPPPRSPAKRLLRMTCEDLCHAHGPRGS